MDRKPAIFLDRDGTLNRDVKYVYRPSDLELLGNVVAGLRRMVALGFELVIVTNQSGVARGLFGEEQVRDFNAALCRRLGDAGVTILATYYCPFHPTEGVGAYRRESPLRKPNPGMILQAAAEHSLDLAASFAIGDKPADVEAGCTAGCRTILLYSDYWHELPPQADFAAGDLLEAARTIEHALPLARQR